MKLNQNEFIGNRLSRVKVKKVKKYVKFDNRSRKLKISESQSEVPVHRMSMLSDLGWADHVSSYVKIMIALNTKL